MKKITALSCLATALALAACGGGGSSDSSSTTTTTTPTTTTSTSPRSLTVTPALGETYNADVTIESLDKSFSATANTSSTGSVTFTIPDKVQAVLVSVKGTATSKYREEANDLQEEPLTQDTTLRAVLVLSSLSQQSIAVTALTEAAARYAIKQGLSNTTISNSNILVSKAFGIGNILRKPIMLKSVEGYATLPADSSNFDASRYTILLTAISKVAALTANSSAQASLKFSQQLASDFEDGDIDSTGTAYGADTLQTQINLAVAGLLSVNSALKNNFTIKTVTTPDPEDPDNPDPEDPDNPDPDNPDPEDPDDPDEPGQSTTVNNVGASAMTPYLGTYTGQGAGNLPCTLTLGENGLISVNTTTASASSSLNGDYHDGQTKLGATTTTLTAQDSDRTAYLMYIHFSKNLPSLVYYMKNSHIEIYCKDLSKTP